MNIVLCMVGLLVLYVAFVLVEHWWLKIRTESNIQDWDEEDINE